jgi:hypothetical protein
VRRNFSGLKKRIVNVMGQSVKVFTSKHEETQMLRSKNAPPLGGAFLAVIA